MVIPDNKPSGVNYRPRNSRKLRGNTMKVLSKWYPMAKELHYGELVELADTLDLGSSAAKHKGSSPLLPTILRKERFYEKEL